MAVRDSPSSPEVKPLSELPHVSDEDKDKAAKLKQDANKAFTSVSTFPLCF